MLVLVFVLFCGVSLFLFFFGKGFRRCLGLFIVCSFSVFCMMWCIQLHVVWCVPC